MKLQAKLVLFTTFSTLIIALLTVFLLPLLVQRIAFRNTNKALETQKAKVLKEIDQNGIDYYLQGDTTYGSYSMLKDEYISLQPGIGISTNSDIRTEQRIIEEDTITYRILTYPLPIANKTYLLEIGRKISTINEDSKALQKMALYVLLGLVFLMLLTHIAYTSYILSPLGRIIRTKLVDKKFPFKEQVPPVKTSTYDFKYLDSSIAGLMHQINLAFEKEREFTSNASHELMTPISIMQSKIENMIADESIPEEQVVHMESMLRTLHRLKRIVNALLLIARIENEQYVRNDVVRPAGFIKEITEELDHRLEEDALSLELQIDENVTLQNVNKELLFQLFYNLIANAIKYNNPRGRIIITDEFTPDNRYQIAVRDTGIGIPSEHLPFVFDRFKKARQASEDSNGLGLSIVKSIAHYHGIEVEVTSVVEAGSAFNVIFTKEHLG